MVLNLGDSRMGKLYWIIEVTSRQCHAAMNWYNISDSNFINYEGHSCRMVSILVKDV